MVERANITPEVLKWARTTAKMRDEVAASKVSVKVEKLHEWENGESMPTINQALKLAEIYKRPFAVFFLPESPMDFMPLQDFRKKGSVELSTATAFIIREIQEKQEWISEDNKENGEASLDFVGKYSLSNSALEVAEDILSTLGIDPLNYRSSNPLKEWIDKAEANGIFVSRTSFIHPRMKIPKEEIQGFAIADPYAPFVFINSSDWLAPQLFTLVHELAHLWIASTGISNGIEPEIKERDKFHPVELFCNEVAANALIPADFFSTLPDDVFNSIEIIFQSAKRLGVSSFAFIVRALNLELISVDRYYKLKRASTVEFEKFLARESEKKLRQKKTPGGPSPYLLRLYRNGRLFTQIILDAYKGGRIEPTLASSLLNVKSNKFHKLEERLYA